MTLPKQKELKEKIFSMLHYGHMFSELSCECTGITKQILALFAEQQKKRIVEGLNKYKCLFNWDYEKNKAKEKSYIALEDVIKVVEGKK